MALKLHLLPCPAAYKSISFADQKTAVHLFFISFFLRKLIIEEGDIPCMQQFETTPTYSIKAICSPHTG